MKTNNRQGILLAQWLDEYKRLIAKVVNIYAFSREEGQDLYQEIALQLWRSIDTYQGEAKPSTWIYQVALNTAMSWSRKHRKHDQAPDTLRPIPAKGPAEIAESSEQLNWLYAEIRKLPEIKRSLVLLYLDGVSYKDMAKILGISESNVGVKLLRIKEHLTTLLKGRGDES